MKLEGSKLVVLALETYQGEQEQAAKEHHERGRARAFSEVFFVLEKLSNGEVSLEYVQGYFGPRLAALAERDRKFVHQLLRHLNEIGAASKSDETDTLMDGIRYSLKQEFEQ